MKYVNLIVTIFIVAMIILPYNVFATESSITTNDNNCKFSWTTNPNQKYIRNDQGEIVFNKDKGIPTINEDCFENVKIELVSVEYKRYNQNIKRNFTDSKTLSELDKGEEQTKSGVYYRKYSDGIIEYKCQTKQNNEEVSFNDGSVNVPKGSIITLRITPNYGYQVTSFGTNQDKITAKDNISEFSFEVNEKEFHLGLETAKVDNIAKIDAKGVVSGSIILDEEELTSGTVRLSVEDANITDTKKEEFQNEVTRNANGCEITNVLNITLNQVFYKGKEDEYWQKETIKNLKKEAIISLKLEKGLDINNTIMIHNINDSDKYEIIDIVGYDRETKTITFKANTFSNYAIATKLEGISKEESNTINTNNIDDTKVNESKIIEMNNTQNEASLKIGYGYILLFIAVVTLIVTIIIIILNRNIKIT